MFELLVDAREGIEGGGVDWEKAEGLFEEDGVVAFVAEGG
jgi:hypothetical protein